MLGSNTAEIKAVITAKDEASKVLSSFGTSVGAVAKTAGLALIGVGVAATAFGVLSVKAYSESEDRLAQLNAVLKSTKGVAGVSSKAAIDLSKSLQRVTKYSDEDVLSVENLLLTFTGISKKIFPEATKTVLNMATALGEDTKSASIQLGKALQDPILGITALRRVGVNFSDKQKEVIKNLVETGQKGKAQALILKELQTEFGGSAEAAGKTFAGSLAKLKNSLNDIEETIGQTIVKAISPFIQKAAEFIAKIDWQAVINNSIAALHRFTDAIVNTYQAVFNYLAPGIRRFIDVLQELWHWVYGMLAPSFKALGDTLITQLWPQLKRIWDTIEPGFTTALKILGVVIGGALVSALWLFVNVLNIDVKILGFLIQVITNVIKWIGNFIGIIWNAVKAITKFQEEILKPFVNLDKRIQKALDGVEHAIEAPFIAAFKVIKDGLEDVRKKVDSVKGTGSSIGKNILDPFHLLHKAAGGPVTSGTTYMVGENGPEMFTPTSGGTITPNHKLGGGGGSINITVQAGAYMGSQQDARRYAQMIINAMGDIASSKNKSVNQLLGI